MALGCGGVVAPPVSQHAPQAAPHDGRGLVQSVSSPTRRRKAPAADPRSLNADATFQTLVQAARAIEAGARSSAGRGCLLRRAAPGAAGLRLDAELAAAVNPIPDPPSDLGTRLRRHHGGVGVLTRWGLIGESDTGLLLSALTLTTPRSLRAVPVGLFLTPEGIHLRTSSQAGSGDGGPMGAHALAARLLELVAQQRVTLFVTANAGVPAASLAELLRHLPRAIQDVALAVTLPHGTRLPRAPPAAPSPRLSCPEGLPELDANLDAGELDVASVRRFVVPLEASARACLSRARGQAAAGGRAVVALRVGADGRVSHACMLAQQSQDPALAACLTDAARRLTFPRPAPAGSVDIHLPLKLVPGSFQRQQPLCET
ncbi:MAG: hypothetical protein MJD61_21295 [Proteobacteria bacterium]|nr:hypothetical protein [Pseudomonadota bacterium]